MKLKKFNKDEKVPKQKRGKVEIKNISVDNIDKDISKINIVDTGKRDTTKIFNVISLIFVTTLLIIVAVGAVYIGTCTKLVQGNVKGAKFNIANISVVDNDYSPTTYLKDGVTIYYDSKQEGFFTTSSNYTVGRIKTLNQKTAILESDDKLRDLTINTAQIKYVLE